MAVSLWLWLRLPRSAVLFVRGLAARRPIAFDFRFERLPPVTGAIQVTLTYAPLTPIFGISQHYTTMISPLQVDTIMRYVRAAENDGHIRVQAPLSIAGPSNYRLTWVALELPLGQHDTMQIGVSGTEDGNAPAISTTPDVRIQNGAYEFDGPLALWQLTGSAGQTGRWVAYSPRAPNPMREVIWPGLRSATMNVDMTAYPVPAFVTPAGWEGLGWHR